MNFRLPKHFEFNSQSDHNNGRVILKIKNDGSGKSEKCKNSAREFNDNHGIDWIHFINRLHPHFIDYSREVLGV
jgi:hypothetical protein